MGVACCSTRPSFWLHGMAWPRIASRRRRNGIALHRQVYMGGETTCRPRDWPFGPSRHGQAANRALSCPASIGNSYSSTILYIHSTLAARIGAFPIDDAILGADNTHIHPPSAVLVSTPRTRPWRSLRAQALNGCKLLSAPCLKGALSGGASLAGPTFIDASSTLSCPFGDTRFARNSHPILSLRRPVWTCLAPPLLMGVHAPN